MKYAIATRAAGSPVLDRTRRELTRDSGAVVVRSSHIGAKPAVGGFVVDEVGREQALRRVERRW